MKRTSSILLIQIAPFQPARVGPVIREALQNSDLMIAVITDNYLRSVICISEISVFWGLNKPVIPIVFDQDGVDFLKDLMGEDLIYINLSIKGGIDNCAQPMVETMKDHHFSPKDEDNAKACFKELFLNGEQAKPSRPYIGSGENFCNIVQYCEKYGVKRLNNAALSPKEIADKCDGCKELFIVSTTGTHLIKGRSEAFIPGALRQGTSITVLLPNRCSSFISDIAEIESPFGAKDNKNRLMNEFRDSVTYLKQSLVKAKSQYDLNFDEKILKSFGSIYLGWSHSLLRQTITLAVWDDRIWGRLSVTLPPKWTIDDTPSIEFECHRDGCSFGCQVYEHVKAIREFARQKKSLHQLSIQDGFSEFFLENEAAEEYWENLYNKARMNSTTSLFNGDSADLIEVAAQHPLRADGTPDNEFAKRLDYAVELYSQLKNEVNCVKIYVPGNVHRSDGGVDPCSLSSSGNRYLIKAGVPENDVFADEKNCQYKGELGVYNSADECWVATQIFKEGDYRRLHCICSPNQLLRKNLFYIAFGVIPFYHTVSTESMAHDDIFEIFHRIPDIIFHDHTWQGDDSVQGNRSRKERKPPFEPSDR